MTDLEAQAREFLKDEPGGLAAGTVYQVMAAFAEHVARRVRAEALAEIAKHECPLGHDVQWCGKHQVYHTTAFDRALSAEAEPAP